MPRAHRLLLAAIPAALAGFGVSLAGAGASAEPTTPRTVDALHVPSGERGLVVALPPLRPITRWHSHLVCVSGEKRGLKPRADGSCPSGTTRRQGSEMLQVWFTGDLRSAFAVQAPGPELCRTGLLAGEACRGPATIRVM